MRNALDSKDLLKDTGKSSLLMLMAQTGSKGSKLATYALFAAVLIVTLGAAYFYLPSNYYPQNILAAPVPSYTLIMTSSPAGAPVPTADINGMEYTCTSASPCKRNLGVVVYGVEGSAPGYTFTGWTCTGTGCYRGAGGAYGISEFHIGSNITETAQYIKSISTSTINTTSTTTVTSGYYTVAVSSSPVGAPAPYIYTGGSSTHCYSACEYRSGTTIYAVEGAAPGYTFTGWTCDGSGCYSGKGGAYGIAEFRVLGYITETAQYTKVTTTTIPPTQTPQPNASELSNGEYVKTYNGSELFIEQTVIAPPIASANSGSISNAKSSSVKTVHPPSTPINITPATQGQHPEVSYHTSDYDEQLFTFFDQNFYSMAYTVTAQSQIDNGTGPAFLVNGVTNEGYWYQVGLGYDWPSSCAYGSNCYKLIYEIWNNKGPISCNCSGIAKFNGPVHTGDKVLINLLIYHNASIVAMSAYDLNTTASAQTLYKAYGSEFVYNYTSNGYFTGLMTEWYHPAPYYGGSATELYAPYQIPSNAGTFTPIPYAGLGIDEYNYLTRAITFGYSTLGVTLLQPSISYVQTLPFPNNPQPSPEASVNGTIFITGDAPVLNLEFAPYQIAIGQNALVPPSSLSQLVVPGTGSPPYTYQLLEETPAESYYTPVTGVSPPCSYNFVTTNLTELGYYNFICKVTDSKDITIYSGGSILVNSDPKVTLSSNASNLNLGNSALLKAQISGGSVPFNVSFIDTATGSIVYNIRNAGRNSNYKFKPEETGIYTFNVIARDVDADGFPPEITFNSLTISITVKNSTTTIPTTTLTNFTTSMSTTTVTN
jgi:hypothetical protein